MGEAEEYNRQRRALSVTVIVRGYRISDVSSYPLRAFQSGLLSLGKVWIHFGLTCFAMDK